MLWSVAVAFGILSGIFYLLTFPEAAAALARGKDDDEEYDDDQKRSGGQEDCDLAWKARVKVCDKIAKAREDLCASRRRITKAQKQIHNLKVAARQVHMQTIMVSSNLTRELIDHHSSGQFLEAAQVQIERTVTSGGSNCLKNCGKGNEVK